MKKIENIEERISKMEEWKTESQGLIKDGWKIIKVYRQTSGSYTKYVLVECIHCGKRELKQYYNFINSDKKVNPCTNCGGKWIDWAKNMIGKIIGHYKILDFTSLNKRESNKKVDVYFKVQCIYCGKIREKELFNESNWNKYKQCPDCPRIELTFLERRYKEYVQGAKDRNIEFNLSFDDFKHLVKQNCYYCGDSPIYHSRLIGKTETGDIMNGIDRIDSSKDYSLENCVPCCTQCNIMKMNYSQPDFYNKIYKIYNYRLFKQGLTTIENTSKLDGSELSTL